MHSPNELSKINIIDEVESIIKFAGVNWDDQTLASILKHPNLHSLKECLLLICEEGFFKGSEGQNYCLELLEHPAIDELLYDLRIFNKNGKFKGSHGQALFIDVLKKTTTIKIAEDVISIAQRPGPLSGDDCTVKFFTVLKQHYHYFEPYHPDSLKSLAEIFNRFLMIGLLGMPKAHSYCIQVLKKFPTSHIHLGEILKELAVTRLLDEEKAPNYCIAALSHPNIPDVFKIFEVIKQANLKKMQLKKFFSRILYLQNTQDVLAALKMLQSAGLMEQDEIHNYLKTLLTQEMPILFSEQCIQINQKAALITKEILDAHQRGGDIKISFHQVLESHRGDLEPCSPGSIEALVEIYTLLSCVDLFSEASAEMYCKKVLAKFPYHHTPLLRTIFELQSPTPMVCIFVLFHQNISAVEKALHIINKSHLISSQRNELYTKVLNHPNIEEFYLALEKLSKAKFLDDEDENEYLFAELLKTPYPSHLVSALLISFKYRSVITQPGQFVEHALLKKLIRIYAHKGRNDEPAGLYAKEMAVVPELTTSLNSRPENKQATPLNSLCHFQTLFSKPLAKGAAQPSGSILESIGQYKL